MKEAVNKLLRLLLITPHKTLSCTHDIICNTDAVYGQDLSYMLHYNVNFKACVIIALDK